MKLTFLGRRPVNLADKQARRFEETRMHDLDQVNREILATREAMTNAGWRFALDSLPGAYLPTAATKPSEWMVDVAEVLDRFQVHCDDPEFFARIRAEFSRE